MNGQGDHGARTLSSDLGGSSDLVLISPARTHASLGVSVSRLYPDRLKPMLLLVAALLIIAPERTLAGEAQQCDAENIAKYYDDAKHCAFRHVHTTA